VLHWHYIFIILIYYYQIPNDGLGKVLLNYLHY